MNEKYRCEYDADVSDLLEDDAVRSMDGFVQHGGISTLEHCKAVSYASYRFCRALGLDSRAAARGGLLHDFFLYDWHKTPVIHDSMGQSYKGMHGFVHPYVALSNALYRFGDKIGERECDIIKTHMWPLTLTLPTCREAYVVILTDKLLASYEVICALCSKTASLYKRAVRKIHAIIA